MKNRIIKFRAWDKEKKTMVIVTGLNTLTNTKEEYMPFDVYYIKNGEHYNVSLDKLELMQFTGRTDKHGKEIYEDDYFEAEEPRFESGMVLYQVVYQSGCFWGVDKRRDETMVDGFRNKMIPMLSFGEIELKGNIYEHPHLLNKDTK